MKLLVFTATLLVAIVNAGRYGPNYFYHPPPENPNDSVTKEGIALLLPLLLDPRYQGLLDDFFSASETNASFRICLIYFILASTAFIVIGKLLIFIFIFIIGKLREF
ncbi:unnamed protein product [Cylicocyclus nassatus]|uniref:Uncharacterized protein n=1 Tax=Cylicocyclus nassatus TaxID=53992 RepID=A0AA36M8K4_CYLNA|nr:unnamed protein product [Cylicocyclus nassatus]